MEQIMKTDNKIKTYKDLNIWQNGMEIVEIIYKSTSTFPKEELYGITSQIRRAALAMPSNISEGFERNHIKEYIQFLYIAKSSAGELHTLLEIANRIGYLQKNHFEMISLKITNFRKMTGSLIQKLKLRSSTTFVLEQAP